MPVWGREASSDERIRNAQGDVIVCQLSRSPSASCPPDRQYNISRLLALFLLSGSFTDCAVLVPPPPYKRPPPPPRLSPRHEPSKSPRLSKAQNRSQVRHNPPAQASQDAQGWHQRGMARGRREDIHPGYLHPPLPAPTPLIPLPTGLREYWESPWATFSRGRSRWRNQFLVDYLQKAGVERSRKQVASHIQVLRNMWKGEPGNVLYPGKQSSCNLFLPQNSILWPGEKSYSKRTVCSRQTILTPITTTSHLSLAPPESDKMIGPIQSGAPHPQLPVLRTQSPPLWQALPVFMSTQTSTLLLRPLPRLRTQAQPWYSPRTRQVTSRMSPRHTQTFVCLVYRYGPTVFLLLPSKSIL